MGFVVLYCLPNLTPRMCIIYGNLRSTLILLRLPLCLLQSSRLLLLLLLLLLSPILFVAFTVTIFKVFDI